MNLRSDYYTVTLTTVGPVHVGSGKSLSKKTYINDRRNQKIIVPNFEKMYLDIKKRGYEIEFQNYMLDINQENEQTKKKKGYSNKRQNSVTLEQWLRNYNFSEKDYDKWTEYVVLNNEIRSNKEIKTFVKDAYGKLYIPGSSLKGALRTCLLAADIKKHNIDDKYMRIVTNIEQEVKKKNNKGEFLDNEWKELETEYYHRLAKSEDKMEILNDIMSCVRISDSNLIDSNALVLCQKWEREIDGKTRPFSLVRECIKPGIQVTFELEIAKGAKEAGINENEIMKAIKLTNDIYYDMFISKFRGIGKSHANTIWIGGGCGFHTKTVTNALFSGDSEKAASITNDIFKSTLEKDLYDKHRKHGNIPHILKCTKYCNRLYQMGECTVKMEKTI